jgi:beta-glucosidase
MNLNARNCYRLLFRIGPAFLAVLIMAAWNVAQGQYSTGADVEKRAEALLGKMTLEEKITLIGGINDFYIRALPRLGLPALRMSDGPMGVHDYGETTAYPAGIALAASWDVDLARRVGISMGHDARARDAAEECAPRFLPCREAAGESW